jgi:GR25 family glycosyltransferase involved in LPS biosynthesis
MNFVPIYIIEMPGSRRAQVIKTQLSFLNLKFEIQEAVIGKNLTQYEIHSLVDLKSCDARLGYRISASMIGAGLSHREVYKKSYASESNWILVLEEDVILNDLDLNLIKTAMSIAGNNPTIIQLFSRATRLVKTPAIWEKEDKKFIFEFNKRIVGSGAPAYLINRAAISLALEVNKLEGIPDWPPWAQKVRMLCIYPWIFNESNEGSTISGLISISRKKNLLRRLAQLFGIHYFKYHKQYRGFRAYLDEEIMPYFLHLFWKINGSKYLFNDKEGPQIF